jgi:hypothetical protein
VERTGDKRSNCAIARHGPPFTKTLGDCSMTARRKLEFLWLLLGALALISLSAFTTIQPELPLPWRRAVAIGLSFAAIATLPISQYACGKWSVKAAAIGVALAAILVGGGAFALWA